MYHYEYVSREEAAPYRAKLLEIIHKVQDLVRDQFTFQFQFVGSAKRNMITYDPTTKKGFDFDVNIAVNDDDENYSPDEIRSILFNALQTVSRQYGYTRCEQSTRVITMKRIDYLGTRIENSCDFAIVYQGGKRQQYIRYNKLSGSFSWEYQRQTTGDLEARAESLKQDSRLWNEVREVYLYKKNSNQDANKRSLSLYAEAVNECYRRYIKRQHDEAHVN